MHLLNKLISNREICMHNFKLLYTLGNKGTQRYKSYHCCGTFLIGTLEKHNGT